MDEHEAHPLGEASEGAVVPASEPIAVETFGGRIHVEWNPQAAVTPLGQLPFFIVCPARNSFGHEIGENKRV